MPLKGVQENKYCLLKELQTFGVKRRGTYRSHCASKGIYTSEVRTLAKFT